VSERKNFLAKKKEKKEQTEKLTEEKNLKTEATAHFFHFRFCSFFSACERRVKRSQNCLVTKQRTLLRLLYCPRIYPPKNTPRESCSDEEDKKDEKNFR
jgi:hypothetical protein|tara:strand:- start:416 stop:712 length:297 start_codon:yes stop_codon:yes gene_type:complete